MPAFIALAASRTSGTNRIPSRKSMPTIRMPSTSASSRTRVGRPAAAEQDVGALDDLGGHAVVEVVVHLLGELVVGQRREIDLRVLVLGHPGLLLDRGVPRCGTVPYDGTAWEPESSRAEGPMSRVQSIERAFAVLAALADGPIGVTEVAERAGLPKSTAARLLASLAREGAVEQVPGDTRYRLGAALATLAAGVLPTRSLAAARPAVARGARRGDGRGRRAVRPRRRTSSTTSTRSTRPNPVSVRDWTGSRIPMHAVSSGQVLLAFRAPAAIERYLARPLRAVHADAHRDRSGRPARAAPRGPPRRLRLGARGVRRGHQLGRRADRRRRSGEVVAAVHVHGPSYRFPAAGAEAVVAERVVTTAARIAGSLRQA